MITTHEAFSGLTLAVHAALAAGLSGSQIREHIRNLLDNMGETA